ncbi:plasmid segregation protein [Shigella sonnei]|nr:plasmid segregation protein [Shigella sonnei]
MTSFEQLSKVAQRADKMLLALTKQIQEQKQEFQADVFYQVYCLPWRLCYAGFY